MATLVRLYKQIKNLQNFFLKSPVSHKCRQIIILGVCNSYTGYSFFFVIGILYLLFFLEFRAVSNNTSFLSQFLFYSPSIFIMSIIIFQTFYLIVILTLLFSILMFYIFVYLSLFLGANVYYFLHVFVMNNICNLPQQIPRLILKDCRFARS